LDGISLELYQIAASGTGCGGSCGCIAIVLITIQISKYFLSSALCLPFSNHSLIN